MKTFKLLNFFCALLICNVTFGQTNLILNPSFESGIVPDGEMDLPTYWSNGNMFRNCTGGSSPDCFDSRSGNADYDVPVNKWTDNTGRTEIFGGYRYVGFVGSTLLKWDTRYNIPISEKPTDQIYGENIISTLSAPIEANCLYKIRFYAYPTRDVRDLPVNPIHNKIEIVFFKEGTLTPCPGWVPFTSQSITNYGAWTLVEGFFTAPADIGALALNKIQIRMKCKVLDKGYKVEDAKGIQGAFIDSLSLYNLSSAGFTPTSGFSFTTHTFSGSNPQASAWSGKNILIVNELIVNSNLTINSSSVIKMGTSAKITVKSPYKLTIDNSKLSGLCQMWQGIVVEAGAKIEITNSHLYDAIRGIKVTGTSSEFLVANNLSSV